MCDSEGVICVITLIWPAGDENYLLLNFNVLLYYYTTNELPLMCNKHMYFINEDESFPFF